MCKTIETSLSTFIFTLTCAIISVKICKTKEVFFAAILMFTISIMQLVDAGIWLSIHTKNNKLNDYLSRYAIPITLSCQLLVSYFGVNLLFGWRNQYFVYGLAAFVIFTLTYWPYKCTSNTFTHTDGYLYWCRMTVNHIVILLYNLFLFVPIFVGIPSRYTIIKFILLIPIVTTLIINYTKTSFCSRWCWSSNITSLLVLAYSIYTKT